MLTCFDFLIRFSSFFLFYELSRERMTEIGEVHADLVFVPGLDAHLEERPVL